MINVESEAALARALIANISRLNCLVFVEEETDSQLTAALNALAAALPARSALFLIGESEANSPLFSRYKIESAPSFVLLNANLHIWRTFTDISPIEFLSKINENFDVWKVNVELERAKFDEIFARFLISNRFVLFGFAAQFGADLKGGRDALQKREISFKEISAAPFREENALTIIAQLVRRVGKAVNGIPFCYFNDKLFCETSELELFLAENAHLAEQFRGEESERALAFLRKNPVFVVYDSTKQSAETLFAELRRRSVLFGYLDCATRPSVAKSLAEAIGAPIEEWPRVVVNGRALSRESLERDDFAVVRSFAVATPAERVAKLIASAPVFLFMKGSPEFPQCGFSRQIAALLSNKGVEFGSYDVLADPELREALKEISNWKTYPQLYLNGELIGGLDIALEMDRSGELDSVLKGYIRN